MKICLHRKRLGASTIFAAGLLFSTPSHAQNSTWYWIDRQSKWAVSVGEHGTRHCTLMRAGGLFLAYYPDFRMTWIQLSTNRWGLLSTPAEITLYGGEIPWRLGNTWMQTTDNGKPANDGKVMFGVKIFNDKLLAGLPKFTKISFVTRMATVDFDLSGIEPGLAALRRCSQDIVR